jgi:hypothetical protein
MERAVSSRQPIWLFMIDALLAFVVASQISTFHRLGSLVEIALFAAVFAALVASDRLAVRKGWGPYLRAGLAAVLFLGLLLINIASTFRHCDRGGLNCHQAFGI